MFVVHALPTVIGAAMLAPGRRARELGAEDRFSLFLYEPWFLVGGALFGAAAWYHMRETRPQRASGLRRVPGTDAGEG